MSLKFKQKTPAAGNNPASSQAKPSQPQTAKRKLNELPSSKHTPDLVESVVKKQLTLIENYKTQMKEQPQAITQSIKKTDAEISYELVRKKRI